MDARQGNPVRTPARATLAGAMDDACMVLVSDSTHLADGTMKSTQIESSERHTLLKLSRHLMWSSLASSTLFKWSQYSSFVILGLAKFRFTMKTDTSLCNKRSGVTSGMLSDSESRVTAH